MKSFIETASSVVRGWLLPSLMCAFALLAAGTANAATVSIVSVNAVDNPNYDLTNTYGIGDWAYWSSAVAGNTSSADPDNAKSGGSLGQVAPGDLVAEMESVLAELAPGQIHGEPVESEFGFHVVRLDQRASRRQLPYESVRPRIELYLRDQNWRRNVRGYIEELAERADIRGFDLG